MMRFRFIKTHPFFSLLLGVLIIIIGSNTGWLPIDRLGRAVVKPASSLLGSMGGSVGNWFREAADIGSLSQTNEELLAENLALQQENSRLLAAQHENQQLRSQLEFETRYQLDSVGADIINYQPDSVRNFIRINRGSSDGVKVGQPVTASGFLVGSITATTPHSSEVMLISDGEFRVLAKTTQQQSPGIIKGRPPSGLVMERIPRDKPVSPGDTVITSGLDGQFPPGIVIGKIISVDAPAEAIFQTAQIDFAVEAVDIKAVSVLRY